jgi:hypothetical protein
MNPSKAWAMLNARALNLQHVGGGTAQPEFTAADIAMRLQGLPRGPFLVGMLSECMDVRALPELERLLWADTMRHAERERWPSQDHPQCRTLASLAICETLFQRSQKCGACRGRGYVLRDHQGVECEVCHNTGGTKMGEETRAALCAVSFSAWRNGWSRRYEWVFLLLQGWRSEANAWLARALVEDEFA